MIEIKTEEEIERMASASCIVWKVLRVLERELAPGVKTQYLDKVAEDVIISYGGIPAFKGYRGFPANICTSVNEEVVHGIPSQRRLKEGDIISIDVGVMKNGYFGDGAATFPVGRVNRLARRLINTTRKSLSRGIKEAIHGKRLYDISYAIQSVVESCGFSVVRQFVGHGIGRALHEEPQLPNFGEPGKGPRLKKGMVLAIEPMVNAGGYEVEIGEDGWTAVTNDRSLSCHFEHTVVVTEKPPAKVLTLCQKKNLLR